MVALILTILFSLLIAFFATQNTGSVTMHVMNYSWREIPIYMVVIVSFLIGVLISWIITFVNSLSSTITILGKDIKIKKSRETLAEYEKRIRSLELENVELKARQDTPLPFDKPIEKKVVEKKEVVQEKK